MPETQVETIEQLQEKLKEQIESLARQRQEEAQRRVQEQADRNRKIEEERQERKQKQEEAEKKHRERRAKEIEAAEAQKREHARAQIEAEKSQSEALESKRLLDEKLQWLKNEITKQQHLEEQYKKNLEDSKNISSEEVEDHVSINVEFPISPVNTKEPGGAVEQTGGLEIEPTTMSAHLRHILRQAQRA